MMFARAIGDTNPVYHDAAAAQKTEAGGIIAPPTFPQAVAQFDPDYHLRPKPHEPWFGSGKTPSGVEKRPSSGGGCTRSSTSSTTATSAQATCWRRNKTRQDLGEGKQARRQADLPRAYRRYRDQNGELVITARSVGVTTERPVDQG